METIIADTIALAVKTIDRQVEELIGMRDRINSQFQKAIDLILRSNGRVVVLGMGKSGIIGKKIAATLASTGTTSFFVHPAEAFHGDLGMIHPEDVVVMISYSGETEEIIRLLPFMEYQSNSVIAITGKVNSTLSIHADAVLDVSVKFEACRNNLAPTSSTTATLVMGDAIATVLAEIRDFRPEDFARFHPGGSLGRRLLTKVSDVMRSDDLPVCSLNDCFKSVINYITTGRLGLVIVKECDMLMGVITDGDLRRAVNSAQNYALLKAKDIMTNNPKTINVNEKFSVAEEIMQDSKINSLLVIDDNSHVVGVLQIYDIADNR